LIVRNIVVSQIIRTKKEVEPNGSTLLLNDSMNIDET